MFIAVCGFFVFRIWFSVFVENTSGFSVFLFCPIWVPVSLRFEWQLISNSRETPKLLRGIPLRAIGAISQAFSVHNKKTAEEASGLVHHCKTVLEEHVYQIRAESNITGALNGAQGHVSETENSVQLMERGLGRLADILGEYDYQALDLLSCMTLGVENCHTTV